MSSYDLEKIIFQERNHNSKKLLMKTENQSYLNWKRQPIFKGLRSEKLMSELESLQRENDGSINVNIRPLIQM